MAATVRLKNKKVNNDKIVFYDKANIIKPKQISLNLNLQKEKNLIEHKTIFQSDNFSFGLEGNALFYSHEFLIKNRFKINDEKTIKEINITNNDYSDNFNLNDCYVENKDDMKYEIIMPKNNSKFKVGKNIYFECAIVTDDELLKEDFDDLIWVSSLDGLIGINNKFNKILSLGEHKIYLIKNENNVIKHSVLINVIENETNSMGKINYAKQQ